MPARTRLGNTRVTGKEQYYTPPATAEWVVHTLLEHDRGLRARQWLEPAAGTGAFLFALSAAGIEAVTALDIEPHHPLVQRADFLTWRPAATGMVAVGNPPFGRNNALSVPFFNHAATMCDTIAFIVPRSWRKWSVTNRLNLGFECVRDDDLHVDYVDAHGDPLAAKGNLRTCLQIWQRAEQPRRPVIVPPSRWVQKCAPEDADVAVRVFGYGCGTVLTDFPRVPNTTLAFLKVRGRGVIPALRAIDFSVYFDNVAYTQALAFSEIRHALGERLGE